MSTTMQAAVIYTGIVGALVAVGFVIVGVTQLWRAVTRRRPRTPHRRALR